MCFWVISWISAVWPQCLYCALVVYGSDDHWPPAIFSSPNSHLAPGFTDSTLAAYLTGQHGPGEGLSLYSFTLFRGSIGFQISFAVFLPHSRMEHKSCWKWLCFRFLLNARQMACPRPRSLILWLLFKPLSLKLETNHYYPEEPVEITARIECSRLLFVAVSIRQAKR